VNGKIYAIGGSTKAGGPQNYTGGFVGTNEEYDPETDTWTLKSLMPTPRSDFRLEVVHNKIYCIDGLTYNGTVTHAIEVYDPATDTWETRASLPTPRESFATVVFRDRIYVIGGIAGRDPANPRGTFTGATEVYDPVLDRWETKASMPNASFPETCVVVNGEIYVISGSTTYAESVSYTAAYDEDTDSWTSKASMPVVQHGAAVVLDDKIYFIGGNSLLQIYDGSSPPQGGVSQGSVFATTGKMSLRRVYVVNNSLRIYDPEKNEWTIGPNKPTNRYSMGIAFLNDKIYAIGGITTIFPSDLFSPLYPTITTYATNEVYTPFGYGTVPPVIDVVSPGRQAYNASSVSLVFTVNKQVNWTGYSLDGEETVTITGNTTIIGLANGVHNVTVYAKDALGNVGVSETAFFTIAKPEPFPTMLVATASVVSATLIGAGLILYFKKRKH
jgi:N-acetylneuraminic acid mutarotase